MKRLDGRERDCRGSPVDRQAGGGVPNGVGDQKLKCFWSQEEKSQSTHSKI